MGNNEIVNGCSALWAAIDAYCSIEEDVIDREAFRETSLGFIRKLCEYNPSLRNACLSNSSDEPGELIGSINIPLPQDLKLREVLMDEIPQFICDRGIKAEVRISYDKPFSFVLSTEKGMGFASLLTSREILSLLSARSSAQLRCIDMVAGGNFFAPVQKMISMFPGRTGGKVYTKSSDLSDMIRFLEGEASKAMIAIGNSYASVEEYNRKNSNKINEYLCAFCLKKGTYQSEDYYRLKILMENGKRNGMSFILIGDPDTTAVFQQSADYHLYCDDHSAFAGGIRRLAFDYIKNQRISDEEVRSIIADMQSSETVDTRYEAHKELEQSLFDMDSRRAVRIPFAVDKNKTALYFEVGGEAPAHALIAGSTGSGKSVLLHTLIMQMAMHYHPDDVEIWAVDYKAVEFALYMDTHTPHFRVIAHDTSEEFSLSLIDLLYSEYERRQKLFLDNRVRSIEEYRRKYGEHSLPRIVAIIDEFQLMTQAVQNYTGNIDYRIRLENLFRLTRAMGMSLVLCSQTIASGLSGLSDAARDQIGCRFCLKHDDDAEIRETLALSGPDASDIIAKAKDLRRGQGIYRRMRWADEYSPDGKAYEYQNANILYMNDESKIRLIREINEELKDDYQPKEEILVRGDKRIPVSEKPRHPITLFTEGKQVKQSKDIEWYPAAPVTLADYYSVRISRSGGANALIIGEDDELRESVVLHTVMGLLIDQRNDITVSVLDEENEDKRRLLELLGNIRCERLKIDTGISSFLDTVSGLKKIRPLNGTNKIYLWVGLEKIRNELFLLDQDSHETAAEESGSKEALLEDLMGYLSEINGKTPEKAVQEREVLSFDDCRSILRQVFDLGPENGLFHIVVFNNLKQMKKSDVIDLSSFDNRLATAMSADDSYDLFRSSSAVSKADENTVVFSSGSGKTIPLRPYLMPDTERFERFNSMLEEQQKG